MGRTESQLEEIVGALWAVCAILSFGFDYTIAGWAFTVKAVLDHGASLMIAYDEGCKERNND